MRPEDLAKAESADLDELRADANEAEGHWRRAKRRLKFARIVYVVMNGALMACLLAIWFTDIPANLMPWIVAAVALLLVASSFTQAIMASRETKRRETFERVRRDLDFAETREHARDILSPSGGNHARVPHTAARGGVCRSQHPAPPAHTAAAAMCGTRTDTTDPVMTDAANRADELRARIDEAEVRLHHAERHLRYATVARSWLLAGGIVLAILKTTSTYLSMLPVWATAAMIMLVFGVAIVVEAGLYLRVERIKATIRELHRSRFAAELDAQRDNPWADIEERT